MASPFSQALLCWYSVVLVKIFFFVFSIVNMCSVIVKCQASYLEVALISLSYWKKKPIHWLNVKFLNGFVTILFFIYARKAALIIKPEILSVNIKSSTLTAEIILLIYEDLSVLFFLKSLVHWIWLIFPETNRIHS